jgi:HEAT repeat protein
MNMAFLSGWQFDLLSFGLGIVLAVVFGFLLFRLRRPISTLREGMGESYRTAVEALTTPSGQGYRSDLMHWAQSAHMLPHLFALEEILLPPRLLLAPPPLDPSQPAEYDAPVLYPFTPDWPLLSGAYGGATFPLHQLLPVKTHTAVVGVPGSGKTVILAAFVLEWLRRTGEAGAPAAGLPRNIYYANALDLTLPAQGKDAIAPLAPAVQLHAATLSGSQIPSLLRGSFRGDGTVLLLDAVDELAFPAQAEVRKWIQILIGQYPRLRVIATLPPEEINAWRAMGFGVIAPALWTPPDNRKFLEQWGTRWPETVSSDRKLPEKPEPALLIGWISRQTVGFTPLDITLRAWAAFSADMEGSTSAGDQQAYINRHLPPAAEDALGQVVRSMLAEGISAPTRRQVESAMALAWPHSEHSLPPVEDSLDEMINRGVMRRRTGGHVSFGHLLIAARLGALAIAKEENIPGLLSTSVSPIAELAASALAAQEEIATLVSARLAPAKNTEDDSDPGRTGMPPLVEDGWRTLRVAAWLHDAPPTAPWRVEVFRRLMKILRAPSQPFPMRTRALCAFLNSRDASAGQLFRQILATEDSDSESRILAALGLGAMGDPSAVEILAPLMEAGSREVRWAGALALGRIASRPALDALGQYLLQGEDDVRRAAAEALALDPVEGHAMLKEAIQDAELLVRRAAVFGLARTASQWALDTLVQVQVEDGQWAVKSAAAQAVEKLRGDLELPLSATPAPSELPWLVKFAAQRKTGIAPGAPAIGMLKRAVREGDVAERAAAMDMLGRLDGGDYLAELTMGLGDGDPLVRNMAFEALWLEQIQRKIAAED